MKREKVWATSGIVALLLAMTLLTGFASPPSAKAEVSLFGFTFAEMWPFFLIAGLVLLGAVFVVGWILVSLIKWIFPSKKLPGATEAEQLTREEAAARFKGRINQDTEEKQ